MPRRTIATGQFLVVGTDHHTQNGAVLQHSFLDFRRQHAVLRVAGDFQRVLHGIKKLAEGDGNGSVLPLVLDGDGNDD